MERLFDIRFVDILARSKEKINMASESKGPSIETKGLTFAFPDGSSGLQNVTLDVPPGSRTLLIGGT